jgi:superfamily II RNA helicase
MAKLHICPATFPHDDIYQTHFQSIAPLTLTLSPFQKWAIKAIVDGDNVLITAHTGSGKTLPAEFAINFFKAQNKKVIYASPIKALSNQKLYDMRRKYPHISFGLLTGDCKDNPEADVLIMTTEILRNTLFNRQQQHFAVGALAFHMDVEHELAAVVFDEVHYINDVERGSVWEQSILLLPPQVQLIMLSATIDRPEAFATWILQEKAKQAQEQVQEQQLQVKHMYLASTNERVVPLTHYMWLSVHSGTLKKAAKTPYEKKLEAMNSVPIVIADAHGVYNELNYYKVKDILDYNSKNQLYVKRQFVLDSLLRDLKAQAMLPAICFIFSRKHVEQAATEISFSLHDEDMSVSIEKECRHILARKLVNYKEYLDLPEYQAIVKLLEKGIAIHHAGLMPVLREMIELLFEKGYIKLLFATETFAVGINMPTKTVIFTGLTKFNGSTMRLLYPHEYTQMAGRAGRRGIDTVGHVFHCNNLFDNPSCSEYKHLLTGPPQKLTSKFKISFNLALNVFFADSDTVTLDSPLLNFTQKSLLSTDIQNELVFYAKEKTELTAVLAKKTEFLQLCRTPKEALQQYMTLLHSMVDSANSQRKKIRQALTALEVAHKFLANDLKYLEAVIEAERGLATNASQEKTERAYISTVIQCVENLLLHNDFLTKKKTLTTKGLVASQLQEVHPLVLADTYGETDGFAACTALDIAALLACFNNIHVSDELKYHRPATPSGAINTLSLYMADRLDYYYHLENTAQIDTGSAYAINYDLQPYIMAWYAAADEVECKTVIAKIKHEKNVFLGEFIKGILKIITICAEFEKICELNGNVGLLAKMQVIPAKMLKYVVTNQSLYL